MTHHLYSVAPMNGGWAVRHRGKVLHMHPTADAARAHVERLARLTQVSGHDAEVIVQGERGEVRSDDYYRRIER